MKFIGWVGAILLSIVMAPTYASASANASLPPPLPEPTVDIYPSNRPQRDAGSDDSNKGWRNHDLPDRSNRSDSSSGTTTRSSDPRTSAEIANQRLTLLRGLQANGAFARMAIAGNGRVALSVVNDLKPNAAPVSFSYLLYNKRPDIYGHHYLTPNFVGKDVDIDTAWKILSEHFSEIFPTNKVAGSSGPVGTGNQYNLVVGGVHTATFVFPVTVTAVSGHSFTLSARPEHWLRGSATHGIVKDADGNVWLYEEGVGVPNEPLALQAMNYDIADAMWARMAANIRARLAR